MKALDTWHKTRAGLLTFAIIELLLAYGTASWAIDTGNLLLYLATIILVVGGVRNLSKLILSYFNGNRQAN